MPSTPPALVAAFMLAIVAPALLAWNLPPSATLLNQALAILGWASVLIATARLVAAASDAGDAPVAAPSRRVVGAVPLVLAIAVVAALSAPAAWALPWSLALSGAGVAAAALAAWMAGAACARDGLRAMAFRAFCWAWLLAGVVSLLIGAVQFFVPQWADGDWIARTSFVGRAVGNLRQPNHLSTLLLWAAVSAWWLGESRALPRALATALYALMLAGVVMTASRTGMVGVLLLALWGLLDRRTRGVERWSLVAAPLVYGLVWWGLSAWAHASGHVFGAEGRVTADGDLSSSRFAIWSNTLALIDKYPWTGVGFGRFNFAWSLTPFPGRPVAFFDHTHNLPLQLAVELGLPLAALMIVLLGWALIAAWHASLRRVGEDEALGHGARAAFVMLLLVALHSQLEYPLWYAHFLLPTAWLFGWALAAAPSATASASAFAARQAAGREALVAAPPSAITSRVTASRSGLVAAGLTLSGLGLLAGGAALVYDYHRVVVIFAPPADAAPLEERIEAGRHSWFFSHHAAYAAITTAAPGGVRADDLRQATYYLLDTRLMLAWAKAYAERGDLARARHLAARLREFHHADSTEFFAPCDGGAKPAKSAWQCLPPGRALDDRDFP